MDIRTRLCFHLSRRLMQRPATRTINYASYANWRTDSLSASWSAFPDSYIKDKVVLDFGCGDGPLSFFLANQKHPTRIVGVDINTESIERARAILAKTPPPKDVQVDFLLGSTDRIPVSDQSFDTLLAFDCLEHVMTPESIIQEWYRVLRPQGRCLIEWYPYKGPWGPHMESLIPLPWAHIFFGERAMFRAAEMIYDLPDFIPRHWDLDEHGNKKPNKWNAWCSFEEQGYINKLDIATFRAMARNTGFQIAREDLHGFGGSRLRSGVGNILKSLPLIGEYFISYVVIELVRPE